MTIAICDKCNLSCKNCLFCYKNHEILTCEECDFMVHVHKNSVDYKIPRSCDIYV